MSETKAPTKKEPLQKNPINIRESKIKLVILKNRFTKLYTAKKSIKKITPKACVKLHKTKIPVISNKADFISPAYPAHPASTCCALIPASLKIDDVVLVAQAQAALVGFDEINKLIKKLTLSFSLNKNESSFFIKTGIFEGARFKIKRHERDINLSVNNITNDAVQLLSAHKENLCEHLRRKEINLVSIMFNS
jgi:hypothetical protein